MSLSRRDFTRLAALGALSTATGGAALLGTPSAALAANTAYVFGYFKETPDQSGDSYALPDYFDSSPDSGPDRWDYYRMRPEGQNTLTIDPSANADMVLNAVAPLVNALRSIGLSRGPSAGIVMILGIATVGLLLTFVGQQVAQGANDLAVLLRAGALPADLTIVEERTVGPSLGADSIEAGKFASMIAATLVFVFMLAAYGKLGIIANVALAANVALIIAILSALGATLTLPGIAGIVLTMGMAVDSNVIIFERVREERDAARRHLDTLQRTTALLGALAITLVAFLVARLARGARERQRLAEALSEATQHDAVTGLPNRRFFAEWLSYGIAHARRERKRVGVLFIDTVYLPKSLRGTGVGSRILAMAEEEGRRRGCSKAVLFTISFQAPEFYKKLGWQVFGEIAPKPPGATRIYLTKDL